MTYVVKKFVFLSSWSSKILPKQHLYTGILCLTYIFIKYIFIKETHLPAFLKNDILATY